MKEYTIKRFNNNWDEIPTLDVDNILWTEDYGIRMKAQIAYDDEKFYVHQVAKEANINTTERIPYRRFTSLCLPPKSRNLSIKSILFLITIL